MLNTLLWIGQGLLAVAMAVTGATKLFVPREKLEPRMHWAAGWPRWRIKLLGAAELAGAAGLIMPFATGIAPVLTPVAALCLAVLMAGAVRTHQKLGESFVPPLVFGMLCVAVAAGRLHA